jgi:hypothetical protein
VIKADQIPDEVLEAMARPVTYPSGASVKYINALHLASALAAWPGAHTSMKPKMVKPGVFAPMEYIGLPLKEPSA